MKRTILKPAVYTMLIGLVCLVSMAAIYPEVGMRGIGIGGVDVGMKAGSGAAAWDTVNTLWTTLPSMTHDLAAFNTAKAAADFIYQFGVDDATFAWATVDTYSTGVSQWVTYPDNNILCNPRATGVGGLSPLDANRFTRWAMTDTSGGGGPYRQLLMRFDPKVPANSTIVSATLHLYGTTWFSAANDTIVSTLMTIPADSVWWNHKSIWDASGSDTYAGSTDKTLYQSKCSYTYQWFATGATPNYGFRNAANSNTPSAKWTPALSERKHYWDWGDVSDWTPTGAKAPATGEVVIDITDCVQAITNGAVNNGIMITQTKETTSDRRRRFFSFEPRPGSWEASHDTPWVEIKYITKRYTSPFPGGADWAFVFENDDANRAFNDSIVDAFLDHGGKYTIFAVGDSIFTYANVGQINKLASWHDQGMEIGFHSMDHNSHGGKGMNVYNISDRDDVTHMTNLFNEMNSDSLSLRADAIGRSDLRSSPRWMRSFAAPFFIWGPYVLKMADSLNYSALRVGIVDKYVGKYTVLSPLRPAVTDTAEVGPIASRGREPRNMLLLPSSIDLKYLVGYRANTTADLDSVKHSIRRYIRQVRGQDRGVLALFSHGFKAGAYTDANIDVDEMRAMLQVVDEEGGAYMTVTEYQNWIKSGSTPIDTPPSYAQSDTFKFEASDRVWFKPDGIDNRVIRGVRDRSIAAAFDVIAPPPPTGLIATPGDEQVSLSWTRPVTEEYVRYTVSRKNEGDSAYSVVAAQLTATAFVDATVVNGSPYIYKVTATDAAGNESASSGDTTAWPGTILNIARPAYSALWYQDPPNSAIAVDSLAALAKFDCVVTGPFPTKGASVESAYASFVADLRAVNSDIIVLTYCAPWMIRTDVGAANMEPYKRMLAYANSAADSSGFARGRFTACGNKPIYGSEYPGTLTMNVARTAAADTVAKIWAEAYEKLATGISGAQYTGLFVDDLLVSPVYRAYTSGCAGIAAISSIADLDGDNTVMSSDADDRAIWQAYQLNFIKALRREFAQRGLSNRLIVGNSDFGLATSPGATGLAILERLDGTMIEGVNRWFPGNAASDTAWSRAFASRDLLTHAQVAPPMQLLQAHSDSNVQFQAEALALFNDSWVAVAGGHYSDPHGNGHIPVMRRRLPVPGSPDGYVWQDGEADPDTLTATWSNYTARMIMQRNSSQPDSTFAIWPYIIFNTATHDTISISRFWEREPDIGAPSAPQFSVNGNLSAEYDNRNLLTFGGSASGDFAKYNVYRSLDGGSNYSLFKVDPVQPSPGLASVTWYDNTATNDSTYWYYITALDYSGNESDPSDAEQGIPSDSSAPGIPASVVASGGPYYVDVDWLNSTASDLEGYYIARAPDVAGAPGTYTARYDSTAVSAYQDSTATSGQVYWYKVRSYDDDGNISAYSDQAFGSWFGTVPATYPPPSNIIAHADLPSAGQVSVVIYPPSDTTGLTSYSLYKAYWSSGAADSSACVLYKTGLTPDGFNGHVFVDTHVSTNADSSYQYTARALYSGNASAKYATPSIVHVSGSFPSATPTMGASGQTGGIAVFWNVISGADSTRIYRGTTAGTQTSLVSVNSSNNPYADTSASANTDYYYKVREYDVQSATWTNYSAVYGPVRWTSVPSGSPSIASVSDDTPAHGQAITLTGSNFGTKATAAPIKWEDFEGYTPNTNITTGDGWSSVDSYDYATGSENVNARPEYSALAAKNGSLGMRNRYISGVANSSVRLDSDYRPGIYIDAWTRYVPASPASANYKPFEAYGSASGEYPQVAHTTFCTSGGALIGCFAGPSNSYPLYTGWDAFDLTGSMHHFQIWLKFSSGSLVADGEYRMWLDGALVDYETNWITTAVNGHWSQLRLGWYSSHNDQGGCAASGDTYAYWDDVYIDNSQARVELGNASTYAACTHREIQVPTSWSASSIGITLNRGSFSESDTPYLFVVTSDGVVSAGKQVTISN